MKKINHISSKKCHICKKEFITDIENSSEYMFIKHRQRPLSLYTKL